MNFSIFRRSFCEVVSSVEFYVMKLVPSTPPSVSVCCSFHFRSGIRHPSRLSFLFDQFLTSPFLLQFFIASRYFSTCLLVHFCHLSPNPRFKIFFYPLCEVSNFPHCHAQNTALPVSFLDPCSVSNKVTFYSS